MKLQKRQNQSNSIGNLKIFKDLISVLSVEAQAIQFLIDHFPVQAGILVEKIMHTKGRIVFSGMGKSGLVARKLVATFSSIGIPSLFLHPSEALHGDLGMVQPDDLFICISKSGTGIELEQILHFLQSQGNVTSLICCAHGILNQMVDVAVRLPFTKEACQLNLAPTTSSTLCMAFGDALGVAVSSLRGFGKKDFAKFHPAGALGKRLLLTVSSLMNKEDEIAFLERSTSFDTLLVTITRKKLGVGIVVDADKKLLGIITDGDLRRACELGKAVFDKTAQEIMTANPKAISLDTMAYEALQIMEQSNITSLVILGENQAVVGLIHIHDLVKAGIS
jgi:arabinose-5-phosphate isomerase